MDISLFSLTCISYSPQLEQSTWINAPLVQSSETLITLLKWQFLEECMLARELPNDNGLGSRCWSGEDFPAGGGLLLAVRLQPWPPDKGRFGEQICTHPSTKATADTNHPSDSGK